MMEEILFLSDFLAGALRIMVCLFLTDSLLQTNRRAEEELLHYRTEIKDNMADPAPTEGSKGRRKAGRPIPAAGRKILAGLLGAFITMALPMLCAFPDELFYRILPEAVWIVAWAVGLQGKEFRMSLFITVFYEMAVFFWQFLVSAGMGVLFGAEDFLDADTVGGQAAVWIFHSALALGTAIWYQGREKKKDVPEGHRYTMVSGLALLGFIAVLTLSEQETVHIPEDTLTMWMILSVVLLMSVVVFRLNRQYETEKELAELKAGQAELLERDYTALSRAYAVNARLFHDFHNHIGVLRQMLSHDKAKETLGYLDALQEPVRGMADTVWTGDETADYLINSKAASARSQKISFHVQVEFPRNTNIHSADLCAILGNLLDNALEAAGKADAPDQRFVRLVVRRINQMLILKVENGYATAPVQEQGELKTTKTDGGLHGWGLKSVRTAAEKYDGMVQTVCEGNIFRAVVTLSYR